MYFILSFICLCSLAISLDILSIYQQCGYSFGEYSEWLYLKGWKRRLKIVFPSVFSAVIFYLSKKLEIGEIIPVLTAVAVFSTLAVYFALKPKLKIKPVATFRFIRTTVVAFVVSVVVLVAFYCLIGFYSVVFCIFTAEYISLAGALLLPYDKHKKKKYIKRAREKLAKKKNLIKIGITGSCGKTSVKNYLAVILEGKYKTYITPKSFNTPLGICRAIEGMPEDAEVFIAEMGARRKGDIKELCDIVKPDVGIITTLTEQHIKTFGSMERLKDTKYELIEGLEGGFAVFSSDDEGSVELMRRCPTEKYSAGFNGELVKVKDYFLKDGKSRMTFIVGGNDYSVESNLLGRHNALDLSLAFAASLKLGMREEEITDRIKRIIPVEHRLELLKTDNGITVIDDGYNANPLGMRSAAEALKSFGGRKFAVVSGIVEGGKQSERLNKEAGEIFGEVADYLIAVGKNSEIISEGAKGKSVEVFGAKDLEEAKGILYSFLKKGDTVIFINDLPDKY